MTADSRSSSDLNLATASVAFSYSESDADICSDTESLSVDSRVAPCSLLESDSEYTLVLVVVEWYVVHYTGLFSGPFVSRRSALRCLCYHNAVTHFLVTSTYFIQLSRLEVSSSFETGVVDEHILTFIQVVGDSAFGVNLHRRDPIGGDRRRSHDAAEDSCRTFLLEPIPRYASSELISVFFS